jgi:hypothetical protein
MNLGNRFEQGAVCKIIIKLVENLSKDKKICDNKSVGLSDKPLRQANDT